MVFSNYSFMKHCRWCGKHYKADRPHGKDGFCNKAHKQAHYRAYKTYVTAQGLAGCRRSKVQVTRKRKKKRLAGKGKKQGT